MKGTAAITLLLSAAALAMYTTDARGQATASVGAAAGDVWSPNAVTVTVGGTVTFANGTGTTHNVFVGGTRIQADAGMFSVGYTAPSTPGQVSFNCSIHPGMTGTINVVAAPAAPPSPGPAPTPGPTSPATDTTAPKATRITASGTTRRAVVRLRLDEAATVTARLTRSGSRRTLERVTRTFAAGSRQVTLAHTLTNGTRYRIALRIVDDAGNAATRTISFTARRRAS